MRSDPPRQTPTSDPDWQRFNLIALQTNDRYFFESDPWWRPSISVS
ncbi:hypothetical protein CBM2585_A130096 [Cupriavidus taiwanensis]|nr:hypothetical protein CBM2585_A130096 [Cupriavidus taiwanensis]